MLNEHRDPEFAILDALIEAGKGDEPRMTVHEFIERFGRGPELTQGEQEWLNRRFSSDPVAKYKMSKRNYLKRKKHDSERTH